jgi:dTDP-glucose 4,6-dehydratase
VILDHLTYAGNLGTIKNDLSEPRVSFIKGNINNPKIVKEIFEKHPINFVVNFAA